MAMENLNVNNREENPTSERLKRKMIEKGIASCYKETER
jgi:hypothetical protein